MTAPPVKSEAASTDAAARKRAMKEQQQLEAATKKAERKKKAEERAAALAATATGDGLPAPIKQLQTGPMRFLPREWARVDSSNGNEHEGTSVSIMTWNMLAQALVRRELFPGSDFLKVKERIPTLMREVLHYNCDVVCLQEVDRLSDHLPSLTLSYGYSSFVGYPNKLHGLLIAHKSDVFEKVGERGIRLDEQPIHQEEAPTATTANETDGSITHSPSYDGSSSAAKAARKAGGLSRSTRNVALFVALKFKHREGGIIVGTHHLFWHPQHIYERVRQTGILLREARKFRDQSPNGGEWQDWPTFLAGDFNSQPNEITYRLLMGVPLTAADESDLARSTVVHQSVDKLHDPEYTPPPETDAQKKAKHHSIRAGPPPSIETVQKDDDDDDGDADSEDEDKVIKNCREPQPSDGLASLEQLRTSLFGDMVSDGRRIRSAYGEVGHLVRPSEEGKWYCDRDGGVQGAAPEAASSGEGKTHEGTMDERIRRGDFEPMWTNFTPLWRLTIDYILLLPPPPSPSPVSPGSLPTFQALLSTHPTSTLAPAGLPRMGIEPSDHVALACRVGIPLPLSPERERESGRGDEA